MKRQRERSLVQLNSFTIKSKLAHIENTENGKAMIEKRISNLPTNAIECSHEWYNVMTPIKKLGATEKSSLDEILAEFSDKLNEAFKGDNEDNEADNNTLFSPSFSMFNMMEYPAAGIVPFGATFEEFPVRSFMKQNSDGGVFISEISDISLFWFYPRNVRKVFLERMDRVKTVYEQLGADELSMPTCHIMPQQICAVPNGIGWCRGVIKSYVLGNMVKVLFVDFGIERAIAAKKLKYLKLEFLSFPIQIIRGCLAYVVPIPNQSWSKEALMLFQGLTLGKWSHAKIVQNKKSLDNNLIVHLEIYEPRTGLKIHEILKKKGYAKCGNIDNGAGSCL